MKTRFPRRCRVLGLLGGLLIFLFSCNEAKHLSGDQALYAANKMVVESSVPMTKKEKSKLDEDMEGYLRPKLNAKFLGLRVKLWIYNLAGPTTKTKGFKHWLKYKIGEPPVLASPAILQNNVQVLQSHVENKGWFHDTVLVTTFVKNKHLTATYTARVGPRYTIRNIQFPDDSDLVSNIIDTLGLRRSLLKKDSFYDLQTIREERIRINDRLQNRGFYYFNPDYLIVDLDTAVGNHQVDMFMRLKEETPDPAREQYRIGKITVYANYVNHADTNRSHAYTTPQGYHIVDTAHYLRPTVFDRTLLIKPNDIYKVNDHNTSLSRLVSLGVFQFVKARFEPASSADTNNKLDLYYYLTPTQKKQLKFEVTALTRDDNTTGTELALSWRHRNLFHGAENFTARIYGGLEGQTVYKDVNSGKRTVALTRRTGADLQLTFPVIVAPFHLNTSSKFVPKTVIRTSYDVYENASLYTLTQSRASFGYQFKNRITSENGITVLGITYVRPTNITDSFRLILDHNKNLAYSIEPQLIIGPSWNFNYNSRMDPRNARRPSNIWFNANVDFSNNLLGIFSGTNFNKTGKQKEIFGVPFAQYMRYETDFRHYLTLGSYSMLVTRVDAGIGISYGNSRSLPFVKSFFAGGANDLRGFRARALGPGKYFGGDPNQNAFLPDQPGDIKLEFNAEYRAKLFGMVRWAMFTDWGNVWTLRNDTSRPGAVFTSHFLDDFAVDIGSGLRFDLTILVLRIDVAVPIRTPWKPNGSRWNFKTATDISDMVLNLAIGYPF